MLMMALVAVLLVATGGSARGVHHRVSAGAGHAAAPQQTGRQLDVPVAHQHDQPSSHHLDLASTPPSQAPGLADTGWGPASTDTTTYVDAAGVTPTGRAPPAL
ncbi:hypothetical protein C3E78_10675 [Aeromicrobium chenweiae]|uniref:Secreted protein n=1 Tax=Aeromicrobium chenweiae TaxID=2079793 RepID=A0A2S0WMR7_9ACTN|nr:hypothetical protein C3E78_10675 [Aeromicrobium chenweiae]